MMAKSLFRYLILLFLLCGSTSSFSLEGTPKVPSQMDFGGMKLKITDAARAEIQQQVDALRISERYFRIKLDRVLLYFPIIEDILKEENMPDDIKYLVIQESGLVSDAVSSSNAVGFWMFKEPAGREVGLRIDKYVDERLNIVSSTRGACRYIKRHNFFFNNWVYSVIAHNTGRAGAERHVDKALFGATRMTIDKDTHWYFKTFLAHKIAFQDEIGGDPASGLKLREYRDGGGKTLDKIAKELKVDEELLFQYNKWLQRGPVPDEKQYSVILPLTSGNAPLLAKKPAEKEKAEPIVADEPAESSYPSLKEKIDTRISSFIVDVNGIPAIIAGRGDNLKALSDKSGVAVSQLARHNEISDKHQLEAGQVYYLKSKRNKAKIYYHTVQPGETLWQISQQYGIKAKMLARKNRMYTIDKPETGRVLWMRKKRPASVPVEIKDIEMVPSQIANEGPVYIEPAAAEIPDYTVLKEPAFEEPTAPVQASNSAAVQTTEAENEIEEEVPAEIPRDVHEVKKGETVYSIARQYGLTLNELMEWNRLDNNSVISIGQRLYLIKRDISNASEVRNPAVNTHPTVVFHTVDAGDTMYSISRKYNISLEQLMKMNNKTNFVLSIGEKLRISE